MPKYIKIATVLGAAALITACERRAEEPVYVEPAPIVAEPTYQKY